MNLYGPQSQSAEKVVSVARLAGEVADFKKAGRRVVHCHGVFDLIHPGHVRHLRAARALGDALVVTITADRFAGKAPGRPAFNEHLRAETLAAFECVDFVAINDATDAVGLIRTIRPDIYAKGSDYARADDDPTGKIREEQEAVLAVGGHIHFTDEIVFSSSQLINAHFDLYPAATEQWLGEFRSRHSANEVIEAIERAAGLNVLVVGEPIIDEYVFCEPLGKSTKDPILALRYKTTESHAGGALAVANHVGGICGRVDLVAEIGETERREEFMRAHLAPTVTAHFATRPNAPTIHKRRFLDEYTGTRLFELYVMDDISTGVADSGAVAALIREQAPAHDFVLVIDYGHGMMNRGAIAAAIDAARFLVVNTQANSGNRGFNTISRYPKIDYACLAMHEAQLETRLRHAPLPDLIDALQSAVDCRHFTITRGSSGSVHFSRGTTAIEVPALATRITDRVGAGDAVLAVTAPLVALGVPWDIVGFVGNIAGAQLVGELGNRVAINKPSLIKAVTALLK